MSYDPPEKKARGGTSGFGDFVYVFIFYLAEFFFIFVGIPFLVVALAFFPIAMYLIVRQETEVSWPLYVLGVLIVFIQILAIQYVIRRYILKPHNKTFGQWIRWKFSPTEIKNRRAEKYERSRKMDEWYNGMGRVHERKELIKEQQATNLRDSWFGEVGDPDLTYKAQYPEGSIILSDEPESIELEQIDENDEV